MGKGKVVSVLSGKGGAGKTTLNSILAACVFNTSSKNVIYLELDPQKSVSKKRKKEYILYDKYDDYHLIRQVNDNMDKKGIPFFEIRVVDVNTFENIAESIETAREGADLVLVDFPGSLTINLNIIRILPYIDYGFIPLYCDDNSFYSTIEFYEELVKLRADGKIKMDFYLFLNRYHGNKNKELWEGVITEIKGKGYPCLQAKLPDIKGIQDYSTILHPKYGSSRSLWAWVEEITHIIRLS